MVSERDLEQATVRSCYKALGEIREFVNDYRIQVFEIAWLTEEQVASFQSDFRIIADYLVQMRKTGKYEPSAQPMVHARERGQRLLDTN